MFVLQGLRRQIQFPKKLQLLREPLFETLMSPQKFYSGHVATANSVVNEPPS